VQRARLLRSALAALLTSVLALPATVSAIDAQAGSTEAARVAQPAAAAPAQDQAVLAAPAAAAAAAPTAAPRTESFYEQVTRGVVRLEHYDIVERAGSDVTEYVGHSDGTGFFLLFGRELYLATVRHITENRYDLQARVTVQKRGTDDNEVLDLHIPHEAWVVHPRGDGVGSGGVRVAAVDVAVARVPWPKDRLVKAVGYCPSPCTSGVINQFAKEDPEPPTISLIFGFPLDLGFKLAEQRPMARMGVIAMVAGESFLQSEGVFVEERVRLVDAEMFPGNSGSPIFSYPIGKQGFELLGLITGANETFDYAVAEPVSRIAETLEAAVAASVTSGASSSSSAPRALDSSSSSAPSASWHPLDASDGFPRMKPR